VSTHYLCIYSRSWPEEYALQRVIPIFDVDNDEHPQYLQLVEHYTDLAVRDFGRILYRIVPQGQTIRTEAFIEDDRPRYTMKG
jgi:hypothetical protein